MIIRRKLRRTVSAALAVFVASIGLVVFASPPAEAALRTFAQRYNFRGNGNIALVANSNLTCGGATLDCVGGRDGTGTALHNGVTGMQSLNVDVDTDPATINSTSSDFTLPTGGSIKFAGLYWGGDTSGDTAANGNARNTVKFKVPGATTYTTLTSNTNGTAGSVDFNGSGNLNQYQGFADVTSLVSAAPTGSFWVADIKAKTGRSSSPTPTRPHHLVT
jgi:large repetitive protein